MKNNNNINIQLNKNFSDTNPLIILLAEDIIANQKIIKFLLNKAGYEIDIVSNGIEALNAVNNKTYDVILMDINMPQMDGIEAAKQIRKKFPEDNQPIIIALTADITFNSNKENFEMDYTLRKPIKFGELLKILLECKPKRRKDEI